jgi:hypothetical protein
MNADEGAITKGMALMAEGYSWARVVSTLGLTPGLTMYALQERWQAMVLSNYVKLEPGIPKRLHLTAYHFEDREITDRITGQPKTIRTLIFRVDREDGTPVAKDWSVVAEKLAVQLQVMLPNNLFTQYDLIVTQSTPGFQADYSVKWEKR